jgi:endonuclease YncB( thermonuclease family)
VTAPAEITRAIVSAANRIANDSKKPAPNRDESGTARLQYLPQYQLLNYWLGRERSRFRKNANNFSCLNQYENWDTVKNTVVLGSSFTVTTPKGIRAMGIDAPYGPYASPPSRR